MRAPRPVTAALAALLLPAALAAQVTAGQQDTFGGGTTQGWVVGPGSPAHPLPPTVATTGGPGGADDAYLLLRSTGLPGSGGRLAAINLGQWTGDYRAAGVGSISMDLANFGTTDLYIRLLWADPLMGPPSNAAVTSAFALLPAGSGWQTFVFDLGPGSLVTLFGTAEGALRNATELRIFHNPAPVFFGPPNAIPLVQGALGVDNVHAMAVVPEPATLLLVGSGLLALPLLLRRRRATG